MTKKKHQPLSHRTIYNLVRLKWNYLAEMDQSHNAEKKDVLLSWLDHML